MMPTEIIVIAETIIIIGLTIQFLRLVYEHGELEKLVKQKEAEVKRYKMERDIAMKNKG